MANCESDYHECCDRANFQQHEGALHITAGAGSQTVDPSQRHQRNCGDCAVIPIHPRERAKVRRKDHCHCGHAASLRDQKQSPAVHECDRRMIRLAQIDILAARRRGQTSGKLSPDKCAAHRDQPAQHPNAEDQKRCVDAVRHLGRIREDSRTHDAAHHNHCGIE